MDLLGPGEELLVVVGGVKEAATGVVAIVANHLLGKTAGFGQPAFGAIGVVQAEQTMDEVCVVVEVGGQSRLWGTTRNGAPGAQQSAVGRPQVVEDKVRGP